MPGPRKRSAATRNAYYNRTRGGAATSTAAPATDPYAPYWEAYGIAATSPHGKMVLDLIKDGELVDEAFDIIADRFNLGPYAPSGGSAPSYASTRQAQVEAQAFEKEQTAASQKFQAEQAAIDRATQERMNRLRDLNDLIQQAMANQQSAREMKFQIREDDFALAGAYTGGLRGVTPAQAKESSRML